MKQVFHSVLVVGIIFLALLQLDSAEGFNRRLRRSPTPFKKHKIVFVDGGWTAPAPPQQPPAEHTNVDHHYHTTVDHHHHHHHHYSPQPPPPPTIHIDERYKANEDEKFKHFQEAVDQAYDGFEKDKKEKINTFKASAEATLDALARLPFQIATDIDFFGSKIKEDLESKKEKDKGISIQVWKHKGDHGGGHGGNYGGGHVGGGWSSGGGGGGFAGSEETVHHHHHYGGGGAGGGQYGQTGNGEAQYNPAPPPRPPPQQGSIEYSSGHNYRAQQQNQQQFRVGGKGKGIQFSLWKEGF